MRFQHGVSDKPEPDDANREAPRITVADFLTASDQAIEEALSQDASRFVEMNRQRSCE